MRILPSVDVDADHEDLRGHLLSRWSGPDAPPLAVREAASALSTYCARDLDRVALSDRHLDLLLARALIVQGDFASARHVTGMDPENDELLHLLTDPDGPWPAIDWVARGICRSASFVAFEGRTGLIDWSRLRSRESLLMEMGCLRLLSGFIRAFAPFWDTTSGDGVLLHRGFRTHAARLTGSVPAAQEWLGWSADLLARHARARGWRVCPTVCWADAAY